MPSTLPNPQPILILKICLKITQPRFQNPINIPDNPEVNGQEPLYSQAERNVNKHLV